MFHVGKWIKVFVLENVLGKLAMTIRTQNYHYQIIIKINGFHEFNLNDNKNMFLLSGWLNGNSHVN